MFKRDNDQYKAYLSGVLSKPCPPAVDFLAGELVRMHPGAAVLLYGSGNSILNDADPTEILFDFYVITPSYSDAYKSRFLAVLNWLIPPNVFYIEASSPHGQLRAKYAILSMAHFEKLVSKKTFHSYFWARFAQPSRIVRTPEAIRARLVACIDSAINVFVARAAPLAPQDATPGQIWNAGLSKSYKAELRAEGPDRVARLLASYGEWPERVTQVPEKQHTAFGARVAWRLRALQGGALSILRLLKGVLTFKGGMDYIAWKISRHSGIAVEVRSWERRYPLLGAPVVAIRYYRLRARKAS